MKELIANRVIPVAVIEREDDAAPIARALQAGGINAIEVTFRTPSAAACIARIRAEVPDVIAGAGTLLTTEQVDRAIAHGALFGVAPGCNPKVIQHAKSRGLPFFPGVMTPSDVETALELGCTVLKFFPASQAGGVDMLKALAGPYGPAGAKFIPLGGIGPANAAVYLRLPIVAAIGGSWLVDKKLVAAGDWAGITKLARQALEIAHAAVPAK